VRADPSDVFSRSPFCADRYPYFDLCTTDSPPSDDYSNGDLYSWYSDTICDGYTYIGSFLVPEHRRGSGGGLIRLVCLALDIMYMVFCPSSRAPASPWRLFCRSVTAVAVMTRANLTLEPAESNQPLPQGPPRRRPAVPSAVAINLVPQSRLNGECKTRYPPCTTTTSGKMHIASNYPAYGQGPTMHRTRLHSRPSHSRRRSLTPPAPISIFPHSPSGPYYESQCNL
jgi:hypothetical protein